MADLVELFDRHDTLVGCDLQNAVGTCVNDQIACLNMLLSVIPYHIRARVRLIAEYASARRLAEFVEDLLREAVRICRKRLRRYHARHLPVAYCRILASGLLVHAAEAAIDIFLWIEEGCAGDVSEAHLFHERNFQFTALIACAECISSLVAEISSIRSSAYAGAVEHYPEYSLAHITYLHSPGLLFLFPCLPLSSCGSLLSRP